MPQELLERYSLQLESVKFYVSIVKAPGMNRYLLELPKLSKPNQAFLQLVKTELIKKVAISATEILDVKVLHAVKQKFANEARKLIQEKIQPSQELLNIMVVLLLNDMLGLGDIEFLLADPQLEEIVIVSSAEPIRVYHKKYGWLETNLRISREEQIVNYANIIARRVGRQITTLQPLLDAHLATGDRANAVLYPINTKGNTITIRKFARDPWTVVDLIKNKTANSGIFALIWQAIEYEMNILVSGGTASGKTTLLNVMLPFIQPNHRIISIEDTRELQLPDYLYWTPLVTRQPNPEGKGEVTMLDLLVNSLRMRPDRIVLGEIRKAREAEVLFEAMHTGHSVYATLHADTVLQTIKRLINPPINLPANLLSAVNLNLVMFRDRRRGIRRLLQVGEFIETENNVTANIIYRWDRVKDTIKPHSNSLRYFEDLSRHTGMDIDEINNDILERKLILDWMVKQNVKGLANVSKIIKAYYKDKQKLLRLVKRNVSFGTVVKSL